MNTASILTLPRNWAITASTHWTPSSYTATSGFKNTTTTLTDSGSYWGTTGYGGDSHEHDDVTTETFASHSMSEHPTSAGALLDSDENHSSSSHTGTTSLDAHSWDDQVPLDSYTSSHPTYNDYVIDYSILGGDTGHTVIQSGSVTSSTTNPNSQSTVLEDYQAPIDLSGLSFEAFKTSMKDKILLSPVHELVIPPPPEAAWYAPWRNPDFSWWEAAKWLTPVNHLLGLGINALGRGAGYLADMASGTDTYWGVTLGTILGMYAEGSRYAAAMFDPLAAIIDLTHNSVRAGARADNATYGLITSMVGNGPLGSLAGNLAGLSVGVEAGLYYAGGSVTGLTPIAEGLAGQDFATGESLDSVHARSHVFTGIGSMALFAMGGIEAAAESPAGAAFAEAEAAEGIIYRRTNPVTGKEYIGQAKNLEAYLRRQSVEDNALRVRHDYEIVERVPSNKAALDLAEENHLRANGGPRVKGGKLQNLRYQMSEAKYRAMGGRILKPTR